MDASGILFTSGTDPNTNLVVGSVTTTQSAVTPSNTTIAVNVGSIPGAGGTVALRFDVHGRRPAYPTGVTQIACQGNVTGTNVPPIVTDDPDTATSNDSTGTPFVGSVVSIIDVSTVDNWGLLALIVALSSSAPAGCGSWPCTEGDLERPAREGDIRAGRGSPCSRAPIKSAASQTRTTRESSLLLTRVLFKS